MIDTAAVNITHQTLFRGEYELEMENWLRQRFRVVCLCYIGLGAAVLTWRVLAILLGRDANPALAISVNFAAALTSLAIALHFLYNPHWKNATRDDLLRGASLLILGLGTISAVKALVLKIFLPEHGDADFLLPLFFWHLIACAFLPWTPRESLRPIVPLLVLWIIGVFWFDEASFWMKVLTSVLGPMILLPGLAVCALRLQYHSEKFRSKMMGKHFLSMRQEISQARTIHESMFPRPHDDGFVRFDYTYTPMRELGGDFIHLHAGSDGPVHLTLLDVTGHGLPSALTVNRLYGELERIRAEAPLAEPGEVLALLNRYVYLTMARHTIFVTALCITIDPYAGKLHWASAGHPPAFMRGANGVVTRLPATTLLLGAVDSNEFAADQKTIELTPGDVVVAYTDGAFEARDRLGESLGLDNLDRLMHAQPSPRNWPQFVASAVQKHAGGRPEDDILIAALTFKAMRPNPVETERSELESRV
jgi:hypothetical protein